MAREKENGETKKGEQATIKTANNGFLCIV
jgi:hypothetical protein